MAGCRKYKQNGLVGLAGVELVVGNAVGVTVPSVLDMTTATIELDKAYATLDESSGDEALSSEVCGLLVVEAVKRAGSCVFLFHVHDLGGGGLHAVGQLIALDACKQFAVHWSSGFPLLQVFAV